MEGKLNILVSGGTGTGKTTMLNVLSSFIPTRERIITIEDAAELKLHQQHVVSLETRPPNIEGKGEITIRDLVRNALRMRPDRIVVGECRGGEALDMLQAMNTGHDGSLTTIHANSPRDALARLETLVLMAGFDLPLKAIRDQVVERVRPDHPHQPAGRRPPPRHPHLRGGPHRGRRDHPAGHLPGLVRRGPGDKITSKMTYTGIVPGFIDKLEQNGVTLPKTFFGETGAKVDVLRRGNARRSA